MFDKLLIWTGNALLAGVLVAIASQQAAFAQDTQATEAQSSGTLQVPLAGSAMAMRVGNLSANPDSASLGLVEVGSTESFTITLTHDGAADSPAIDIGAVNMLGQSALEFFTSFGGFTTLAPGQSQPIDVTFTPVVPGSKSAVLSLEIDGASTPFVVLMEATSRYPLLAEIGSSKSSIDFGEIIVGIDSTVSFNVSNTGSEGSPLLNIDSAQLTGTHAGSFSVDFAPVSLADGELQQISVTFEDNTPGVKTATLTLVHDGNNALLEIPLSGRAVLPTNVPISFSQSKIDANLDNPTSLMFGPDNKLYVSEQEGAIKVFNTQRSGKNNYNVQLLETINLVKNVPNHDDDGAVNNSLGARQVTGMLVTGTAAQPVIWVASSDPRIGGGGSGVDRNLDTNSGILHKLTKSGGTWSKQDVVRGLPRSEENHAPNGIIFKDGKLLIMSGGFTNQGVPSNNFAGISEYALSAALLEIDVAAIGNQTYDLPTLDDEDRPGNPDANDPFGGNNGKNQAKLVAGGPVQIFSPGYRNAYDIVLTQSGKLYTFDNGPNVNWGGPPQGAGCNNNYQDGGTTSIDHLHLIERDYYAGHPNPVRGNKGNTFNSSNPQSPVEVAANPEECNYFKAGSDGALSLVAGSTNGMAEYTATNFAATMKGDLLAVNFSTNKLWRFELNGNGTQVDSKETLADLQGANAPLDVIAQGDGDLFPGTIWVVDVQLEDITVLEPSDY